MKFSRIQVNSCKVSNIQVGSFKVSRFQFDFLKVSRFQVVSFEASKFQFDSVQVSNSYKGWIFQILLQVENFTSSYKGWRFQVHLKFEAFKFFQDFEFQFIFSKLHDSKRCNKRFNWSPIENHDILYSHFTVASGNCCVYDLQKSGFSRTICWRWCKLKVPEFALCTRKINFLLSYYLFL